MTTTAKQQIIEATEIGRTAFLNDKKCVPYHDKNIMAYIAENTDGKIGSSNHILKAWLNGFMAEQKKATANVLAEVVGF